ncbi:phenylacetate--CoA ligase family protein [Streptomyces sp. UG1]|uniref:phenylacetate--CoA ligase family protein n=1 Tax=Streptomyces sp. UG1 TaxID=3417652 RepID=UPI003CF542B0
MSPSVSFEDRELWDASVQSIPPDQLKARAEAALAREWERVWSSDDLAFYQDFYQAAGLDGSAMPSLSRIPSLTKNDLRRNEAEFPPFGTHRSVRLEHSLRMGMSTGTTGKPWFVFFSKHDLDEMLKIRVPYLWRVGLRPGGRFAHSWPLGLYPSAVLGGRDYAALDILEIPMGPPFTDEVAAEHVRLWQMLRPTGYMLTGSQLQTYDRVARGLGIDLADVMEGASLLLSEASCQFEGPRSRIEEGFGVRLHNLSGASELPGFTSTDCRFHTGLHVSANHHVVQVVDPETGEEVVDGERGHLVVSAFGLDAFALRYDLEDIVSKATEPCPCGETGPRYTFWGRGADAATVQGRRILPMDVQLALDNLGSPEFRMVPGDADVLRLSVESTKSAGDVAALVEEHLGVRSEVAILEVGSLPRASFKPRRIEVAR